MAYVDDLTTEREALAARLDDLDGDEWIEAAEKVVMLDGLRKEAGGSPAVTPPSAHRASLEDEASRLREALAELVAGGEAVLRHEQGPETIAKLGMRLELIEQRLPYVDTDDDALAAQILADRVTFEEQADAAKQYGPESARGKQAHQRSESARMAALAAEREQKARVERASMVRNVSESIDRRARSAASDKWMANMRERIAKARADDEPQWVLQKLHNEAEQGPPAALIETERQRIRKELTQRDAGFILSRPI